MNRTPPLPVNLLVAGPGILPLPPLPPQVLVAWRDALDRCVALPDAAERNHFARLFLLPQGRAMRIEAAEHPGLLAAACRATMHLIEPLERQAVAMDLITPRSIQVGTQSGDATVLHALSTAMHALPPAQHAAALSDLLTGQGAIDALKQGGRPDIVADLMHDAALRLPPDDTLPWAMGELMADEVVGAAMESGRASTISKTAFATRALPDQRRPDVMARMAASDEAMACVRDTGGPADVSMLADALAAQRTPTCTMALERLMTASLTQSVAGNGNALDLARWAGATRGLTVDAREPLWRHLFTEDAMSLLAESFPDLNGIAIEAALRMQDMTARRGVLAGLTTPKAVAGTVAHRHVPCAGSMASAATYLMPEDCAGVLSGLLQPELLPHLVKDASALFRLTAAIGVSPEQRRGEFMTALWTQPDAIGTMTTSADLSACSFVGAAMAKWLPVEHRAEALAALLPEQAFHQAHESGRDHIIARMRLAAEALPEERQGPAKAALLGEPASPTRHWKQIETAGAPKPRPIPSARINHGPGLS